MTDNKNTLLSKNERASLLIEYWKQTSNVQQHFNDVSMKLRNFAVVVFSGFLTGVGLAIHKNVSMSIIGYDISAGVLFAIAGLIATQLIHFMDTYWYHVFLKGAVSTSSSIEREIKEILDIEELTEGISSSSQKVEIASLFGFLHLPLGWNPLFSIFIIIRKVEADSTKRHKIFYRWLLLTFIAIGIGTIFTHPENEAVSHIDHQPEKISIKEDLELEKKHTLNSDNTGDHIISGSNVRLRSSASLDSEVMTLLPLGKKVSILEENSSSWVKVSIENTNNCSGIVNLAT